MNKWTIVLLIATVSIMVVNGGIIDRDDEEYYNFDENANNIEVSQPNQNEQIVANSHSICGNKDEIQGVMSTFGTANNDETIKYDIEEER